MTYNQKHTLLKCMCRGAGWFDLYVCTYMHRVIDKMGKKCCYNGVKCLYNEFRRGG